MTRELFLSRMGQQLKSITESTLVPISLVLCLLTGTAWLTSLYNETKAHAAAIETQAGKIDQILEVLNRIQGKLGLYDTSRRR